MKFLKNLLWHKRHEESVCSEGEIARCRAEQELERVKAETPYYRDLGADLRQLRERNHFAESLRATLRGTH